ncbi:hypothetical protein MHBO_001320 [Bonamia ostreae]|uniref:Uncharacterized protein n=1 Tax=Bonamia ostreae TaxID=126728 RepID=A0ABV2AIK8_9EUKA
MDSLKNVLGRRQKTYYNKKYDSCSDYEYNWRIRKEHFLYYERQKEDELKERKENKREESLKRREKREESFKRREKREESFKRRENEIENTLSTDKNAPEMSDLIEVVVPKSVLGKMKKYFTALMRKISLKY